ncbi:MAG: PKD domain-containing protein [Thermoplasmatota archaeon]
MFESKKKWAQKSAVSEVLGTVLLLGIAVIIFSGLVIYVMSATDNGDSSPDLDLVGYVGGSNRDIIIEHRGGESLDLKNVVIYVNKGVVDQFTVTFDKEGNPSRGSITNGSNGRWGIGSYYSYDFGENIQHWQVEIVVVDQISNSIVMSGIVNTGIDNYLSIDDTYVDFTWTPLKPLVDETVAFTGKASLKDSDGDRDISWAVTDWNWDFGDGNFGSEADNNINHPYDAPGTYAVMVTVTYDPSFFEGDGPFKNTSDQRDVRIYQGPIAKFTYRWDSGFDNPIKNEYIYFEAAGSYDPDGFIESYVWSFGDGSSAEGDFASHKYSKEGDYTVRLTVTDDDGLTNWIEDKIKVSPSLPATFPFADTNNDLEYQMGIDINVEEFIRDDGVFYTWRDELGYDGNPDWSLVFPPAMDSFDFDGQLDLRADNTILIDTDITGVESLHLEATDVMLSDVNNINISVGENGGDSDVLDIDASGNVYANNTYFYINEVGAKGTTANINADGNIYLVDANFTFHENGHGGTGLNIETTETIGGIIDMTRAELCIEKATGTTKIGECAFSIIANSNLIAVDMRAHNYLKGNYEFDRGNLRSRTGYIDISGAYFIMSIGVFTAKTDAGDIIAEGTFINAKSEEGTPMFRGHTALDFTHADITNNANSLTLTSDAGHIFGEGATVAQAAVNQPVNIWFGPDSSGTGNILLPTATITTIGGGITIKTTNGYIFANVINTDSKTGATSISTANGPITADYAIIHAGQVAITTNNGNITLSNANIDNDVNTVSIQANTQGKINVSGTIIDNTGAKVTIKTANGDVFANQLEILESGGTIDIQTAAGRINLTDASLSTEKESADQILITSSSNGNIEMSNAYMHAYKGTISLSSPSYINGTNATMKSYSDPSNIVITVQRNLYLNNSKFEVPGGNNGPYYLHCYGNGIESNIYAFDATIIQPDKPNSPSYGAAHNFNNGEPTGEAKGDIQEAP